MAKTAICVVCGVVSAFACQVYSEDDLLDAADTRESDRSVNAGSSGSRSQGGGTSFGPGTDNDTSGGASAGSHVTAGNAGRDTLGSAGTAGAGAVHSGGTGSISQPAIFYVPHQDDDYLAMALGIAEHVASGRHVKVILYTDGANEGLRNVMNGRDAVGAPVNCPLYGASDPAYKDHPRNHGFDFTSADIVRLRMQEFDRSMAALGVTDVEKTGWADDATDGKEYDPFTWKLKNLILENAQKYPGASHKCVSGAQDCQANGGPPAPTHIACWYAAKLLMSEFPNGVKDFAWDFLFYDDHIYSETDPAKWHATFDFELVRFMPRKQAALAAYHDWDPSNGKYALGYHALPALFDNAKSDSSAHAESIATHPADFECAAEE